MYRQMQYYCNRKCNKLAITIIISIYSYLYIENYMFIKQSLQILQKHNQKKTKTRLWILEELANIKKPANPYELLEINPNTNINITTIYRNLELFESLDIVHKVSSIGGYIPCSHKHDHCEQAHDMIICNICHHITETHIDLNTKKLLWLGWWPIELNGECIACVQKK